MLFVKKMIYGSIVFCMVFFGLNSSVHALQCNKNEIELNTEVPGIKWGSSKRCLPADTATDQFGWLMGAMMKVFINITLAVAFLMLVASGVMIAMGWADQGMATKWKDLLRRVIIGIALIWLSGLILNTINPNFFKVANLDTDEQWEYTIINIDKI